MTTSSLGHGLAHDSSVAKNMAEIVVPAIGALLSRIWSRPGAMHPNFRVGQIAVNAMANLIVWDTGHPAFWPPVNPLRNLAMADPVGAMHGLIVAGQWVGTPGDFHRSLWQSEAYTAAREEADARLKRLLDQD